MDRSFYKIWCEFDIGHKDWIFLSEEDAERFLECCWIRLNKWEKAEFKNDFDEFVETSTKIGEVRVWN